MRAKVNQNINLSDYSGVLVVGEQNLGKLHSVTLELLGEGRKLSNKINKELSVILLGDEIDHVVDELIVYDIDNIIVIDRKELKNYNTDFYSRAVSHVIMKMKPEIVLCGATSIGRDLAPRIAAKIGTGLTADCTKLEIDESDGKLLQTRPAFGGNLMATIICPKNRPQMSTVRPGVMEKIKKNEFRNADREKNSIYTGLEEALNSGIKNEGTRIIKLDIDNSIFISNIEFRDIEIQKNKQVNLQDANVIVSGGRGLKSKEGFELIQELANTIGGVVGASRAAVDSGWIDHSHQVGQTGTTVRPDLYIACGISGAIQHIAGMSESKVIVAINKDANAPIFKICDYGIVGDLYAIIPEIIEAFKSGKLDGGIYG